MSEEYISLKPSEAVHGGGMVPEGRYKITDAKFCMWDYNGTQPNAVPALGVEYKNADEMTYSQYYSAGDAKNVKPSADGQRLVKVGSTGGLNDSTNVFQYLKALVNAGLGEEELGAPIGGILIGMDVDIIHEAVQEREIRGQKRAKTALPVIGKIHPRTGSTGKQAPAAASKGTNGQAAASGDLKLKTLTLLVDALKATDSKQIEKKNISGAMFKKISASDPDRFDVLNLAIKDDFLGGLLDSGVLYDAGTGMIAFVG